MGAQEALLSSFLPKEWSEKTCVKAPPFTVEEESGRVYLVPRDKDAEARLSGVGATLGMNKVKAGLEYLVCKGSVVKAIREFEWFTRRSWRDSELAVLWALVYIGENHKWTLTDISLREVASVARLDLKETKNALRRLFKVAADDRGAGSLAECTTDRHMVEHTLKKRMSELPTGTEEAVMAALCSDKEMSVAEIYERVMARRVGVGAVYKVVERLKKQGYVCPVKYFRVNERGPMREMLSSDCRNCFYGFTDQDACLRDTLRQLQGVLRRDYDRSPTREERSALYASMKSTPSSSRTNRKVLTSLKLMHEIEIMMSDGRVSGALKKIEEQYGLELPLCASEDHRR